MVFSSAAFMFLFLPITLGIYYILSDKLKNIFLLLASIVFFSFYYVEYLDVVCLSILINYISAILISNGKAKKLILTVCMLLNLGLLAFFKYIDFFADIITRIPSLDLDLSDLTMPIGISFFTFQGMSYTIDVYRNDAPVQKNLLKYALFIFMFPKFISGPIVRYNEIREQLDHRKTTLDDFVNGIERFIIGLGKKVIISNSMAELADNIWSNGPQNAMITVAWLGSIAYALQIYFDFSGYSDMAIGLGRMFGFSLPENFNMPYISKSITEFWRRWHISLSSWFRDYVYIPLGGNRKRVYLNLSIVFILTGIWHGSSLNYIVWGIFNGVFILLERFLKSKGHPIKQNVFGLLYALFIINISLVFVRAGTMSDAMLYLSNMFSFKTSNGMTPEFYLNGWNIFTGILGIIFASTLPQYICGKLNKLLGYKAMNVLKYVSLVLIMFVSILGVVSGTHNSFVYFQF